jgi:hypothetical protein
MKSGLAIRSVFRNTPNEMHAWGHLAFQDNPEAVAARPPVYALRKRDFTAVLAASPWTIRAKPPLRLNHSCTAEMGGSWPRIRRVLDPSLSCLLAFLLVSCASLPKQTYLKGGELSTVEGVVLKVSGKDIEVRYSRDTPMPGIVHFITFLGAVALGPAAIAMAPAAVAISTATGARAAKDSKLTGNAKENLSRPYAIQSLRGHLKDRLLHYAVFKRIAFADEAESERREMLLGDDYQALIELKITEVSFRRVEGDRLGVQLAVSARMTDLRTKRVIWERHEQLRGNQTFAVDELADRERARHSLDQMIAAITDRLAADLAYSK